MLIGAGSLGASSLQAGDISAVAAEEASQAALVAAMPVDELAASLPVAEDAAPWPGQVEDAVDAAEEIGTGNASYYGKSFAGRRTASGEAFDPTDFTAAHRTLPMGSKVRVTDMNSGKSVVVRINYRGPFHGNRVIDVSRAAADHLGFVSRGSTRVKLELLSD